MALHSKERYEPRKVERLLEHLRLYYDKGQPIDYEVIVDGFKVVRRTNDPNMFSLYESFVDADTKSMEVLLYTGNSNNNDKRIFYFGEPQKSDTAKDELGGIELKDQIKAEVKREAKFDELERENSELKADVAELTKEVEKLEEEVTRLEGKQSPLNSFLGDLGANLVENFIKRNPKIISAIPGGETLAGLIEGKAAESEDQSSDTEVTFQHKSNRATDFSEEDQAAIAFVNQLKGQFNKEEFDQVLTILQTLANDKSKIGLILNHINIKTH